MSGSGFEEELKQSLNTKKFDKLVASFSGACINKGHCYSIDNDQRIFVKTNASPNAPIMFQGEFESLKQIIATNTIRAPKPFTVTHSHDSKNVSALAIEFLDLCPLENQCAKFLGKSLANLHDYNNKVVKFNKRASKWVGWRPPSVKQIIETKLLNEIDSDSENSDVASIDDEEVQYSKHSSKLKNSLRLAEEVRVPDEGCTSEFTERFVPEPGTEAIEQFGFHVPTSCGLIPQVNEWTDEWVIFYARYRLDKPIRSILSDHGDRELMEQWSHLQLKIGKFFTDFEKRGDDKIIPALLHGDLWSGNVAQLIDASNGVIYDPSSFYGHSEYDFGIVRMFGGFPKEFEQSYFDLMPKKKLFEKRNKLYLLFHHLNHWDHFGSGYRASSLKILKDLNATT